MIAFDAGVLIAYKNPKCAPEIRIRIEGLVTRAITSRQRIIIPSPAVTEFLAGIEGPAEAAKASLILTQSKNFRVASFGERASLETALVISRVKTRGTRKHEGASWAKAKFDWQIAAIAKVEGAESIFTTDNDVVRAAGHFGLHGVYVPEMDLPDEARQGNLPL